MPLTSPPRARPPASTRLYQAIPDASPLYPRSRLEWPASPIYRRRVTPLRHPRGCDLVRPCTLASQMTRMLLFNGCSGVLSVIAALLVWTGSALSVLLLPLCGCGVSVFNGLLHTVFYLSCTDVFIYNALAASAADCIDMDVAEWGGDRSSARHPLLPITMPPPVGGGVMQPCPRFERSLGAVSPRSVMATVYFGSFKVLIGAGQMLAVGLVLAVLGFLIGDKRVPIHLDAVTAQHPFAVYTTAFGLLLLALALLHGMTRASKAVTRFFCCETVC